MASPSDSNEQTMPIRPAPTDKTHPLGGAGLGDESDRASASESGKKKSVAKSTRARTGRPPAKPTKKDKKLIDDAVATTLRIASLGSVDLQLLAILTGCKDTSDTAALVWSMMDSDAERIAMVATIIDIAESDPLDAGLLAAGMERGQLRAAVTAANTMLSIVGADQEVKTSGSDMDMAKSLAMTMQTFNTTYDDTLTQISKLSKFIG